jgi:arabinofuranan 3-O-arabinosyltransferase
VYGADVTAADSKPMSVRRTLLAPFRPRTTPMDTASVVRLALWPLAIMSIIHRAYVLSTWGAVTNDFARCTGRCRISDSIVIYNEHFNYVDPHYLYPPGGTLLLAPFGFLPSSPRTTGSSPSIPSRSSSRRACWCGSSDSG